MRYMDAKRRVVPAAVMYADKGLGESEMTAPRNNDDAAIITVCATILRTRTSLTSISGARLLNTFVTCCTATKSVAKPKANRAITTGGRSCTRVCSPVRDETSHVGIHHD